MNIACVAEEAALPELYTRLANSKKGERRRAFQQLVEQRYVVLGAQHELDVVVTEGLREGESVIVEGLQRVRPGVEVSAVLAGTTEGN